MSADRGCEIRASAALGRPSALPRKIQRGCQPKAYGTHRLWRQGAPDLTHFVLIDLYDVVAYHAANEHFGVPEFNDAGNGRLRAGRQSGGEDLWQSLVAPIIRDHDEELWLLETDIGKHNLATRKRPGHSSAQEGRRRRALACLAETSMSAAICA